MRAPKYQDSAPICPFRLHATWDLTSVKVSGPTRILRRHTTEECIVVPDSMFRLFELLSAIIDLGFWVLGFRV